MTHEEATEVNVLLNKLSVVTTERDRLRDQNADLLGQLDAVTFAHNVMQAERDRLRGALKEARNTLVVGIRAGIDDIEIDVEDHVTIRAIDAALQEAGNE